MKQGQDEKKKYEKPVVSRYSLRVEEAVLGFCKSASVVAPQGATPGCKNVQKCFTVGS